MNNFFLLSRNKRERGRANPRARGSIFAFPRMLTAYSRRSPIKKRIRATSFLFNECRHLTRRANNFLFSRLFVSVKDNILAVSSLVF